MCLEARPEDVGWAGAYGPGPWIRPILPRAGSAAYVGGSKSTKAPCRGATATAEVRFGGAGSPVPSGPDDRILQRSHSPRKGVESGESDAFDRLMELVYDELRDMAHHHLQLGARNGVVDTTALVHEAYLRLASVEEWDWKGRAQFFAFCSRAMRHVLIDFARRHKAAKRGGARIHVPLREDDVAVEDDVVELLVVDDLLRRLEARGERMSRVFECRYFGGMTVEETAVALDTSPRTVEREWARARTYLRQALEHERGRSGEETGET